MWIECATYCAPSWTLMTFSTLKLSIPKCVYTEIEWERQRERTRERVEWIRDNKNQYFFFLRFRLSHFYLFSTAKRKAYRAWMSEWARQTSSMLYVCVQELWKAKRQKWNTIKHQFAVKTHNRLDSTQWGTCMHCLSQHILKSFQNNFYTHSHTERERERESEHIHMHGMYGTHCHRVHWSRQLKHQPNEMEWSDTRWQNTRTSHSYLSSCRLSAHCLKASVKKRFWMWWLWCARWRIVSTFKVLHFYFVHFSFASQRIGWLCVCRYW